MFNEIPIFLKQQRIVVTQLSQIEFETIVSYDKANKSNIVKFIMFREMIIQTGRVILFLIMTVIATLTTSFLLGGGASLLYLFF